MHRIEAYTTLSLIFIAVMIILYLPIFFIFKKKGKEIARQLSYLLCFWSFFIIIFATILFVPITFMPEQHILNLKPLLWLEVENINNIFTEEIVANIMMFVPLGIFTPIVFKRMRKLYMTALITFTVTFSIEFFQYFIGRSADINDLITNLSGGIIGYGIFKIFNYILRNKLWWNKFAGTDYK